MQNDQRASVLPAGGKGNRLPASSHPRRSWPARMHFGLIRRFVNLWPPLLFSGIRVDTISPDWRRVVVGIRLKWWNCNAVGTLFGGSLFAMTEPFYNLMLYYNMGPGYTVWDKRGEIDYLAPGRNTAGATFELTQQKIDEIRSATEGGKSFRPTFQIDITDTEGKTIARVVRTLHVRSLPGSNPAGSAPPGS